MIDIVQSFAPKIWLWLISTVSIWQELKFLSPVILLRYVPFSNRRRNHSTKICLQGNHSLVSVVLRDIAFRRYLCQHCKTGLSIQTKMGGNWEVIQKMKETGKSMLFDCRQLFQLGRSFRIEHFHIHSLVRKQELTVSNKLPFLWVFPFFFVGIVVAQNINKETNKPVGSSIIKELTFQVRRSIGFHGFCEEYFIDDQSPEGFLFPLKFKNDTQSKNFMVLAVKMRVKLHINARMSHIP